MQCLRIPDEQGERERTFFFWTHTYTRAPNALFLLCFLSCEITRRERKLLVRVKGDWGNVNENFWVNWLHIRKIANTTFVRLVTSSVFFFFFFVKNSIPVWICDQCGVVYKFIHFSWIQSNKQNLSGDPLHLLIFVLHRNPQFSGQLFMYHFSDERIEKVERGYRERN